MISLFLRLLFRGASRQRVPFCFRSSEKPSLFFRSRFSQRAVKHFARMFL